jgi:hypothetical protein
MIAIQIAVNNAIVESWSWFYDEDQSVSWAEFLRYSVSWSDFKCKSQSWGRGK